MLYVTGHVAGIYWVGTLEAWRGKGYGAALTVVAACEGKERGCTVASLQASVMGYPVYERIGFKHDRTYFGFELGAAEPEA